MASSIKSTESNFRELTARLRNDLPRRLTGSAEVIALHAGATTKAATYWQSGHCLPSLAHALAMAQHEPHLRRLIMEIINAENGGTDERYD